MDSVTAPFRPLTVSDLIDETFQIFRRNFVLFVSIGAVLLIPMAVVQVLQQLALQRQGSTQGIVAVGLVSLVIGLLRLLVFLAVLSAIIHAASEIRMGRRPNVTDCYMNGMDRLPAMIRTGIILIIILPLTFITIIGIPVAIYLAVAWLLSLHVAVIEGEGAFASLSRSRALVKGNWWRVLGITILVTMIVSIVNLIFSIPSLMVGIPLALSNNTHTISAGAAVISTIFGTIGTIITGPVIYIAWLLLYYDLRARKEGMDLEMMASRTEAEAQAAPY